MSPQEHLSFYYIFKLCGAKLLKNKQQNKHKCRINVLYTIISLTKQTIL